MRTVESSSGHAETMNRLLEAITRRGLTVFAQIDHAAAAREIGAQAATLEATSSLLDGLARGAGAEGPVTDGPQGP